MESGIFQRLRPDHRLLPSHPDLLDLPGLQQWGHLSQRMLVEVAKTHIVFHISWQHLLAKTQMNLRERLT